MLPDHNSLPWAQTDSRAGPYGFTVMVSPVYPCAVATTVRLMRGSLSCSCTSVPFQGFISKGETDLLDIQPFVTGCPWRKSDNFQNNPHTKSWSPRRTIWGSSGSSPAGTKLALCFWRALRRELTTSVSRTPRTLKCFVQERRTPWK